MAKNTFTDPDTVCKLMDMNETFEMKELSNQIHETVCVE